MGLPSHLSFAESIQLVFLRIDKSDPDGPYLFLELKKSVNEIIAQRTVLLEVKREDFIPHK